MFKGLGQKGVTIFTVSLCAFSLFDVCGAQSYEQRIKEAEHVAAQLIRPNIALFDLHNNTDLKRMTLDLIKVAKDPKIHGILLWIDSHGGGSAIFSSVHDTLLRVAKLKPIIALVRGNALSGGYHIASAAHYIFAHSESVVGCIGTIITIKRYKNPKIKENGIEADLEVTLFPAGKYKTIGNLYKDELNDDEKNEIQKGTNALAQQFTLDVAHNRNLDITKTDQWADAREFIAREAVELGLIDEVGTAFEAEAKMVELIREKNPDKLVSATVEYIFFDCVTPSAK